ncbi:MAG: capsular biosynthesis protein CpsI [Candidatus Pelagibacter sp.]|nr:capsular biosynthesis protein CpsI [Candidatus Pelagibacter sp.]RPG12071.1 MAG: NAD-dependent epimerase/dehydratase family protein [Pelagibacteraceae bacterium TMED170]
MKILVTGCAGFIGHHVSVKLMSLGYNVIGIDNIDNYYDPSLKKNRLKRAKNLNKSFRGKFKFIKLDLCNKKKLIFLFKKFKFKKVIHLAAQAGVRYSLLNPHKYINSNILGFLNILEGCRAIKCSHLIYGSSSSVYGANTKFPFSEKQNANHPIQIYAATKRSNELMAHSYSHLFKIPTTGLRFFTVYGPWGRPDMALFSFTKKIKQNKKIKIFNYGKHERDFTYIDDVVKGIINVLKKGQKVNRKWNSKNPDPSTSNAPFGIFNIGNGKSIKLSKYIDCIEKELGKKAKKQFLNLQPGDIKKTQADTKKIKRIYNYKSDTTVEEGIRKFVNWFNEYY